MTTMDKETWELMKEQRETTIRIEQKIDDGFGKLNGRVREAEKAVGCHETRIGTLEKAPSPTKAIVIVGSILMVMIALATFLGK